MAFFAIGLKWFLSSRILIGVVGLALACSEARILGSQDTKVIPLRKVGARHIGSLVRIRGMVTRTTEVKPLMIVAAYTCSDCETAIYQVLTATHLPHYSYLL